MKDNRLTHSDIDKIRRRLDLLLKDCARYMKKEDSGYFLSNCSECEAKKTQPVSPVIRCDDALNQETRLFYFLRGVGIYDTGVRPPTIPKELRQLRGRVRIVPKAKQYYDPVPKGKL